MKMTVSFILFMMSISFLSCKAQNTEIELEHKIRQAKNGAESPPLLILLHGLGSNEDDLFQLANYLDENYLIVFARAPYTVAEGRYKWYDVDFSSGKPITNAEQAESSRKVLKQFIGQLKSNYSFDSEKVIIGGFSQGAIMSYSIGLTEPDLFAGIIALSGRMLDDTKSRLQDKKRSSSNVLLIHGTKDAVLPIQYAHQAKAFLTQRQVTLDYHEIDLGHSINQQTIDLMNAWLAKAAK